MAFIRIQVRPSWVRSLMVQLPDDKIDDDETWSLAGEGDCERTHFGIWIKAKGLTRTRLTMAENRLVTSVEAATIYADEVLVPWSAILTVYKLPERQTSEEEKRGPIGFTASNGRQATP